MPTIKISLSDGREIPGPHRVSGRELLELLEDWSTVTLGSVTPLKNGDALRGFRFIDSHVESIDLSGYAHIFECNKQLIGRINLG